MASPFQTPANERSFSSLIDDAILVTGKPGSLISAVSHTNLVIRECQALGLFARDLTEDNVVATAEPNIWFRPPNFRRIRAVKYPAICDEVRLALPGRIQKNKTHYFYAADNYYAFKGIGAGNTIALANYYWAQPLVYYARLGTTTTQYPGGPYPIRPAYFDISINTWMYLSEDSAGYVDTLNDPVEEARRQSITSMWLLDDWRELVLSGVKSKLWNSSSDTRGPVEYSSYKATQTLLRNTVGYEAEDF